MCHFECLDLITLLCVYTWHFQKWWKTKSKRLRETRKRSPQWLLLSVAMACIWHKQHIFFRTFYITLPKEWWLLGWLSLIMQKIDITDYFSPPENHTCKHRFFFLQNRFSFTLSVNYFNFQSHTKRDTVLKILLKLNGGVIHACFAYDNYMQVWVKFFVCQTINADFVFFAPKHVGFQTNDMIRRFNTTELIGPFLKIFFLRSIDSSYLLGHSKQLISNRFF